MIILIFSDSNRPQIIKRLKTLVEKDFAKTLLNFIKNMTDISKNYNIIVFIS